MYQYDLFSNETTEYPATAQIGIPTGPKSTDSSTASALRMPRVVGIAGLAGAGKDTLAAHLVEKYGFVRRALADPMKELLNKFFDWDMMDWDSRIWKESPILGQYRAFGQEYSPRQLAQWLGTEVGRSTFGSDCWVRLLDDYINEKAIGRSVVVPDIRFANEARYIKHELGGIVVEVRRANAPQVAAHVSERGLPTGYADVVIHNNGTIDEFLKKAVYDISEAYERC